MRILTNTTKIVRLLGDYANVDYVQTRRLKDMLTKASGDYYDIIYFAKYVPPLIDFTRGIKTKSRLVVGMHVPIKIEHVNRPHHVVQNIIMPLQVMFYLRRLNAYIHVLNKDDEHYLTRIIVDRKVAFYLPLGTDTELFKPLSKFDIFTVMYSARASWQKGTDIAVKVLKTLVKKFNDKLQVKIVSYGPLTHLYRQLMGYGDVEILDYLPANEYAQLLSKSHALLFTSRYESFAQLPLDSLAAGTPVVSFDVRGFVRDVLKRDVVLSKYVVDFGNTKLLIDRIVELLNYWYNNEGKYQNLIKHSRSLAENFSMKKLTNTYLEMFKSILMRQ